MKNLNTIKQRVAMFTLGAGILLSPLALSAQTASPSSTTATVEPREEHHDYGWVGLLGLIGLAGLLRRNSRTNIAERTTGTR